MQNPVALENLNDSGFLFLCYIEKDEYKCSVNRFNVILCNQKEGVYDSSEKTDTIYIKDGLRELSTTSISIPEFCQNIIDCYYANQDEWLNFCNAKNRKGPEEIHALIKEIHDLLPQKSHYVSVVRSKENQGISLLKAWATGKYEEQPKIIAKIYNNKVFYDDDAAKADMHAQNIIHDALEFPAPWRGYPF